MTQHLVATAETAGSAFGSTETRSIRRRYPCNRVASWLILFLSPWNHRWRLRHGRFADFRTAAVSPLSTITFVARRAVSRFADHPQLTIPFTAGSATLDTDAYEADVKTLVKYEGPGLAGRSIRGHPRMKRLASTGSLRFALLKARNRLCIKREVE